MQVITGDIDSVADPELRRLLRERVRDMEPYSPAELGYFLIVEPRDGIEAVDAQLGFSILGNRWNGTRWGDPAFTPSWEILSEHQGWYELVFVLSDYGSGVTVFVPKQGADSELLTMCRQYTTPGDTA